MTNKSIMPDMLTGVAFYMGLKGVGKSSFAAQCEDPDLTAYLDCDFGKARQLHNHYRFGMYVDVADEIGGKYGAKPTPLQAYMVVSEILANKNLNGKTHIIIDGIELIEKAFGGEVRRDPTYYGVSKDKISNPDELLKNMGALSPGIGKMLSDWLGVVHSKGCRLVTAISLAKPSWINNKPVEGKYRPNGVGAWQAASVFTVAVEHGKYAPVPQGIIIKEASGVSSFDRETRKFSKITRRLPMKMPRLTWDDFNYYLENPANFENPPADEVPTPEEVSRWSEKLSKEQLMMVMAQIEDDRRSRALAEETQKLADLIGSIEPEELANSLREIGKEQTLELFGIDETTAIRALSVKMDNKPEIAKLLGIGVPLVVKALSNGR